ncbi:MAG: SDR family NAD(P)-dependent oxidoreductase [Victivallales bacterium]|nr:SDR family NAD(P)-dependent oxidoreductase [Victivallales bacterium]
MNEKLANIAELSRLYGNNPLYVFLGGGNTSVKDGDSIYIKPSGVALATIQGDDFLRLDRTAVEKVFTIPCAIDEKLDEATRKAAVRTREAAANLFLESAVRPLGAGRPSVETPLHEIFQWTYIVHLHPALVNGMTCAKDGKAAAARLFPEALWMDYCDPGYTLSNVAKQAMDAYASAHDGNHPHVIFLQNHGVFVGAETPDEIKAIYQEMTDKLSAEYAKANLSIEEPALPPTAPEALNEIAPKLRTLLAPSADSRAVVTSVGEGHAFRGPLSPDHCVYAKSFACIGDGGKDSIETYRKLRGYLPKVIEVKGSLFTAGATLKDAASSAIALKNAMLVENLTQAFGGPNYLADQYYRFLEEWEVESYRAKVNSGNQAGNRLNNRICLVTGGAQGFGLGIAKYLAANGGIIVIADMNLEGARKAAAELCKEYGAGRSIAVGVNISDEASVEQMATEVVRQLGGLDLLVANAGVVRAGSVMEIAKKDWDFVTNINYTGYFLCCKYVSRVMAAQIVDGAGLWSDIVQVNSKSGLEGSNKNGAYAGSKFGTIGLTESFALELVTSKIKVNSVCPGNYLDGPLWSDPVKGLFVQYLNAGKVPGTKSVEDVREFYMSKVPMHRGCLPEDVARAIIYCVEQQYETGQAIPVTGGQVMLH